MVVLRRRCRSPVALLQERGGVAEFPWYGSCRSETMTRSTELLPERERETKSHGVAAEGDDDGAP